MDTLATLTEEYEKEIKILRKRIEELQNQNIKLIMFINQIDEIQDVLLPHPWEEIVDENFF